MNGLSSREDIEMDHEHMKRCSKSLVMRETCFSPTMRWPLLPIKMAAMKRADICEDVMWRPLCIVGKNGKQCSHWGKWRFL